jgi:hypothetical protein
MTTEIDTPNLTDVELSPSYKIPLFLIVATIPLSLIWIWVAGAIALLGIFLTIQTKIIRLRFTITALDVYRFQTRIRSFPYTEWSNWRIFWQSVPILFYFREVNSIHFLPIIFDPITLTNCLKQHCPQAE